MKIAIKQATMSTIEIAKLTNKQHKNVLRDVENMFEELENSIGSNLSRLEDFEKQRRDSKNRVQKYYELPKREVLILVSGYNVNLRAAIIDRLEELEAGSKMISLKESLQLSLQLLEKNEQLEEKAVFFDEVMSSEGLYTVQEAAKLLQTGEQRLFKWLRDNKYLMFNNEPYQKYIEEKYFHVKLKSFQKGAERKQYKQTFITEKGLVYLQKKGVHNEN